MKNVKQGVCSVCLTKSVVKAVMFVPYTHGSRLAKKLREAEVTLEDQTGYRLKIVERAGRRLEDMLHKSDPWEGTLCGRPKCLPCKTKKETGKYQTQSCVKRNAVYETWCVTCAGKEMTGMDEDEDDDGSMSEGVSDVEGERGKGSAVAKYIGETARSTFERGFEHLSDLLNLSHKSHMLRDYVEAHMGEDFSSMKFHMRTLRFTRTAFERQILESVLIQENRGQTLLNSKSEFNRCSIPRITLKMGDSEIPVIDRRAALEMQKEESIMSKIRELRKQAGRKRGNARGNPRRKKMKLDEESLTIDEIQDISGCLQESRRVEDVGVKKRTLGGDEYENERVSPKVRKRQRRMTDFLENKSAEGPQHLLSSVPRTVDGEISGQPDNEEMSERLNTTCVRKVDAVPVDGEMCGLGISVRDVDGEMSEEMSERLNAT